VTIKIIVIVINRRGAEGYCSCLVQNCFRSSCLVYASYVKVRSYHASLGKIKQMKQNCFSITVFLVILLHFVRGEFVFATTAPYITHLLKYTAILFPLVSYTNETSGLFFHHFIRMLKPNIFIPKILKSLLGFQVKFKISNNL